MQCKTICNVKENQQKKRKQLAEAVKHSSESTSRKAELRHDSDNDDAECQPPQQMICADCKIDEAEKDKLRTEEDNQQMQQPEEAQEDNDEEQHDNQEEESKQQGQQPTKNSGS